MVAEFQHGLVRLDVVLVALGADRRRARRSPAIWMRLGVAGAAPRLRVGRRSRALAAAVLFACTFVTASWDASENRDELVPASRRGGARAASARRCAIEVHLAPEDPRRVDLERRALVEAAARDAASCRCSTSRRRRSACSSRPAPHYGEIWYELGGRRAMSRVDDRRGRARDDLRRSPASRRRSKTTTRSSAGIRSRSPPRGAAAVFYGIWPALVVGRRHSSCGGGHA